MNSAAKKVHHCFGQSHAQSAGHKSVGKHVQFMTRVDERGVYIGFVKVRLPDWTVPPECRPIVKDICTGENRYLTARNRRHEAGIFRKVKRRIVSSRLRIIFDWPSANQPTRRLSTSQSLKPFRSDHRMVLNQRNRSTARFINPETSQLKNGRVTRSSYEMYIPKIFI